MWRQRAGTQKLYEFAGNARQKRLERKEARASKFISNIKKKTTEMAYGQGFDTAKPMADMSNINASKKKKKK